MRSRARACAGVHQLALIVELMKPVIPTRLKDSSSPEPESSTANAHTTANEWRSIQGNAKGKWTQGQSDPAESLSWWRLRPSKLGNAQALRSGTRCISKARREGGRTAALSPQSNFVVFGVGRGKYANEDAHNLGCMRVRHSVCSTHYCTRAISKSSESSCTATQAAAYVRLPMCGMR